MGNHESGPETPEELLYDDLLSYGAALLFGGKTTGQRVVELAPEALEQANRIFEQYGIEPVDSAEVGFLKYTKVIGIEPAHVETLLPYVAFYRDTFATRYALDTDYADSLQIRKDIYAESQEGTGPASEEMLGLPFERRLRDQINFEELLIDCGAYQCDEPERAALLSLFGELV